MKQKAFPAGAEESAEKAKIPSCHPEQANTPCGCLRVELSKICNKLLIFERQNAVRVLRIYEGIRVPPVDPALRAPSFGRVRLRKQYSIVCFAQDDTGGDARAIRESPLRGRWTCGAFAACGMTSPPTVVGLLHEKNQHGNCF